MTPNARSEANGTLRDALRKAERLLREAGARGANGYPPSDKRVREHEVAAHAVEEALRQLSGVSSEPLSDAQMSRALTRSTRENWKGITP